MPYNGSGVFNRLYSWVNDAAANIKIRADRMDNEMNGMAVALSTAITKDGQTTITANLPMAGFRHTGVGNAASRTDYAAFGQVQDGKAAWVDGGGTADAITAAYSIPITTLVDGQLCYVRATAANATTTPTFSPNGLTARTIVKNGGQALVAGDIAGDGHELVLRYDLPNTHWELMNPRGTFELKTNNFRLTLTTGVPVTTTDVTSASTVFLTPYNGNQIALFTAGQWVLLTSAQVSLALSGLTSNRPYDVFAWNNAGTVTLETLVWTNDTTRATALAYQDGVLVKSGDATRRYLGTFYALTATTTEDSTARRYLFNYYNRANRTLLAIDPAVSWTYTTATIRAANANTTLGQGRFGLLVGVAEDAVTARYVSGSTNVTAGVGRYTGVGINSTTVFSGIQGATFGTTTISQVISPYSGVLPVGLNYIQALEYSAATGTTTFYATTGVSGSVSGLEGTCLA